MRHLKFAGLTTALITICGFAFFAHGQTATPTPKPKAVDDDVIKVTSRLIVIPASVTDANGLPVPGLDSPDFKVSEEGRAQTIDHVSGADKVPLEIALLFDVSASTDTMFKFELETAAKFLREVMRPEDRASVFTVGAKPVMIQPRDTAERSIAAIGTIAPTKEFTAFFDSVGMAADYLRRNAPEGSRRVILVISDGEDTNSARIAEAIQKGYRNIGEKINTIDNKSLYQLTVSNRNEASARERQRILQMLQNGDTVFYAINPAGSSFQLNKMSISGQENLQKFADDTGGTAFLPKFQPTNSKNYLENGPNMKRNTELLDHIFRQLTNELRSQYLIQYYSESDFKLNQYVKLDVALQNHPGLKIRSRLGYYVKN